MSDAPPTCSATTKKGAACPIEARPSGLCHVHDPQVQCGYVAPQGRRCQIATGGGRCAKHQDQSSLPKQAPASKSASAPSRPKKDGDEPARVMPAGTLLAATDGAALPTNPGPCAWGYVLADAEENVTHTASGYLGWGTNNIGELAAIQKVLAATEGPITIRSDSQYAINCLTKWAPGWRRNGWRTGKKSGGKPVANRELIEDILAHMDGRNVDLVWVRGHNTDRLNHAADRAANDAATRQIGHGDVDPEPDSTPCPDGGHHVTADAGL